MQAEGRESSSGFQPSSSSTTSSSSLQEPENGLTHPHPPSGWFPLSLLMPGSRRRPHPTWHRYRTHRR